MNLTKTYWKPLFLSWIIYIFLSMLLTKGGFYGFHLNIVLGIVSFGLLMYCSRVKSKNSREKVIKTILVLSPVLFLMILLFAGRMPFYMSPNFIFAQLTGIILALIYERLQTLFPKLVILILPFIFGIWIYLSGANLWQHFVVYNTFKSGETIKEAPLISFRNDSIELTNSNFKGKVVVLYLCNTCFPLRY